MPLTHAAITDAISQRLQDTGNAIWADTEIALYILDGLREVSTFTPYLRKETFKIESRTGTATSTTASALVDATESQFLSADVGKVIFNDTDKTWAVVTAYVSATQLTLSKDIMASGESYQMFNANCFSEKDIDLSDLKQDFLQVYSVEYPMGEQRNWTLNGDILTIDVAYVEDSKVVSSGTQPDTEVYITFERRHFLSALTDLAGAVNNAPGYAAGSVSMAVNGLQASGTITEGQEFTVAGIRGSYIVTADATISGNAATISFYPGLESTVAHTTVVTFKGSTLTPQLERVLTDLVTARTLMNYVAKPLQQISTAITTVASAATAIGKVDALITAAIATIALGNTEVDKNPALVSLADTEFKLINAAIDLATAALADGHTLINTVTTGDNPASHYATEANAQVNTGQGFLMSGKGLLAEAQANVQTQGAYLNEAAAQFRAASERAQEGIASLREMSSRLQLANTGSQFQQIGERKLALCLKELKAMPNKGRRTFVMRSRV